MCRRSNGDALSGVTSFFKFFKFFIQLLFPVLFNDEKELTRLSRNLTKSHFWSGPKSCRVVQTFFLLSVDIFGMKAYIYNASRRQEVGDNRPRFVTAYPL